MSQSCMPSHNTRMNQIYSTQGKIVDLSMNDKFACEFARYLKKTPDPMPKYQDFKTGETPPCCNKLMSDQTPYLVGNSYYNKDIRACKDNPMKGKWNRVG